MPFYSCDGTSASKNRPNSKKLALCSICYNRTVGTVELPVVARTVQRGAQYCVNMFLVAPGPSSYKGVCMDWTTGLLSLVNQPLAFSVDVSF